MGKTLFDKVWDNHIVDNIPNGPSILYVDQHLIHEVTSPQAFSGLKKRNIDVFRKEFKPRFPTTRSLCPSLFKSPATSVFHQPVVFCKPY